jgi:hypothetical protein
MALAHAPLGVTSCDTDGSGTWLDIGTGNASSYNDNLVYQGNFCRGRRIDNQIDRGMWYDVGVGNEVDLRNSAFGVSSAVIMWIWVTHPTELYTLANGGVRIRVGSGINDYYEFNVLGSDNYPVPGGWVRVGATMDNPDATSGTFDSLNARYFGIVVNTNDVAGSLGDQNVAIDQINAMPWRNPPNNVWNQSVGFSGGSIPAPLDIDDLIANNGGDSRGTGAKHAHLQSYGGGVLINAVATIGDVNDSTALTCDITNTAFLYPDSPATRGDFQAFQININNVGSVITVANCLFSSETAGAGNFSVSSSVTPSIVSSVTDCTFITMASITANFSSAALGFEDCKFVDTAVAVINGSFNGCSWNGVTTTANNAALTWGVFGLTPPDFDGSGDNLSFTKGSATKHAIELDTGVLTTMSLRGHSYSGYAATDGSNGDEVIYNNSGKAVTLNILDDGDVPTIRNGTGASTTIVNNNDWTIEIRDTDGNLIAGTAEITVVDDQNPPNVLFNEDPSTTGSEVYSYDKDLAGNTVTILVVDADYVPLFLTTTQPGTATTTTLQLQGDRVYDNPP